MRIRTFNKLLEVEELEPLVLRDVTVVIDGQNFFYRSYEESGLNYAFGCESDRYATYLRELLGKFKKANVTCYFLFKGGHENMSQRLEKPSEETRVNSMTIAPIYMKDIYKEVLDEMGFQYAVCEYESKKDLIALAQRLNCPVISYDVEFCFSGLQYIPSNELKFNEADNSFNCRYFLLEDFLIRNHLTTEKIALFVVLTDEKIFPEGFFLNLFKHLKIPLSCFTRNSCLLKWLSKISREQILLTIFKFLSSEDKIKFSDEESKVVELIGRREECGLGAECALWRDAARVTRADPRWFAKGVAAGHVASNYINLYRSKHFFGSLSSITFPDQDDAMLLSLDIVKYAYDLLTNFQNDGFTLVQDSHYMNEDREMVTVAETHSIQKPSYKADVCVFENGWTELGALGLLEHFAAARCGAAWQRLPLLPGDARLLVLALVYFSRKRPADSRAAAVCVLLSYVTLSVVFEKIDKNDNLPKFPFASKPILDSSTDKNDVTAADCSIAAAILAEYHTTSESEVAELLDRELVYGLVQFQHVLSELSNLNVLCGAPLPPPALRRLYNGTLVYKLLRALLAAGDTSLFLDKLLSPAPTVYAFLNGLIETYEDML